MAMDFIKGKEAAGGLIVTPKGRLLYPELFKATLMKGETDEKRAAFRATLLFPKTADLALLAKGVQDAIDEEWGAKVGKVKKPFLKTEDQPRLAALAADYPVFIRLSTRQAPTVVFANRSECKAEDEVYGGRWAVVSVRPGTWNHDTGGKGVSFYMDHIMLLDHDEPIGSSRARVDDVFDAVETEGAGSAAALFD